VEAAQRCDGAKGPRLFDWAAGDGAADQQVPGPADRLGAVFGKGGEECFQTANETGLDHYQVLRCDAWCRQITVAMLAHADLAVTAASAPKTLAAASSRARSEGSAAVAA
jgi:hypothetical protein